MNEEKAEREKKNLSIKVSFIDNLMDLLIGNLLPFMSN